MHNVLMLSKFYKEFCGIYLCYFISGYLIHKHIAFNFDKEKNVKIIDYELTKKSFSFPKTWITDKKVLFVFLILGLLSHNALLFLNKDLAWKSTWYANSPFIFFNSLLLYLIILFSSNYFLKYKKVFSFISKVSFGVYLVHYAFVLIIVYIISQNHIVNINNFSLFFILSIIFTLSLSICFCILLFKTPKLKFLVS